MCHSTEAIMAEPARTLRSLPFVCGGLSLRRVGVVHKAAFASSFLASATMLAGLDPALACTLRQSATPHPAFQRLLVHVQQYVPGAIAPTRSVSTTTSVDTPSVAMAAEEEVEVDPDCVEAPPAVAADLVSSSLSDDMPMPEGQSPMQSPPEILQLDCWRLLEPRESRVVSREVMEVMLEKRAAVPTQRALTRVIDAQGVDSVRACLTEGQDQAGLAWWRSGSAKEASAFLQSAIGNPAMLLLDPPESFSRLLSLRLLRRLRQCRVQEAALECGLCKDLSVDDRAAAEAAEAGGAEVDEGVEVFGDPGDGFDIRFHCLSCRAQQGQRTQRHDAVRDCLANLLRRVYGKDQVNVEVPLPDAGRERLDIEVQVGGRLLYVDVMVVNPAANKYLRMGSSKEVLVAAKAGEQRKRERYEATLRAMNVDPQTAFVPFVLEATGRLGPAAAAFLAAMEGDARGFHGRDAVNVKSETRFFRRKLQHVLAQGNSFCVATHVAAVRSLRA